MRRIIRKVFFAWDYDKEEKWLNEMAAKGLSMVSYSVCKYEFEDCDPGEYKICLQLLDNNYKHPESQKYIEFIESTGAEHVGSYMRWVYFRRKAELGEFEMFSDNDSRVKYLSKVIAFIALIGGLNLFVGIYNILIAALLHMSFNFIGLINVAIGIWAAFGVVKLLKKKKKIKSESQLYE